MQPAGPVQRRAAPAQGADGVEPLLPQPGRAVSQSRQVGDHADEPEQQRDHQQADDVECVPHQRAAELRPQIEVVRIGQGPVEEPGAAQMDDRIDAGRCGRQQRNGFRDAVQCAAPVLPQQQQQRRNHQCAAGISHPPVVADDVQRPADRDVVAPDADAPIEHPAQRHAEPERQCAAHRRRRAASACRRVVEGDAGDLRADRLAGVGRRQIAGPTVLDRLARHVRPFAPVGRTRRGRWCGGACSTRPAAHSCVDPCVPPRRRCSCRRGRRT